MEYSQISFGRRRSLICRVSDGTGALSLRFFYFSKAQAEKFSRGATLSCYGEVRRLGAELTIVHPEYRWIRGIDQEPRAAELTAVYPTTEGLRQLSLRRLIRQCLVSITEQLEIELLPTHLVLGAKIGLLEALNYVHLPPPDAPVQVLAEGTHPAQQRLAYEELLAHHLSLRQQRQRHQCLTAPSLHASPASLEKLLKQLPFSLTAAQQRALAEIQADIIANRPMLRLLQGDVGSGKTVVAALVALQAIAAGQQVAVMAPTEILAEQHFQNFQRWLNPLGYECALLVSGLKLAHRRRVLAELSNDCALVVGTHALFQKDVTFRALGLVIVDEQHRFGVHQRLALRKKGMHSNAAPHQLIMTATPIPRSLAMVAYADLDVSIIDELPTGRQAIHTVVMPVSRRDEVLVRVRAAVEAGRQAYWVCPLVAESEQLQAAAAEDLYRRLKQAFPMLKLGLVHGRLTAAEKDSAMQAFKQGDINLLIATTVIEVGVDVPNASLMIIENAERMGLSQLHQLRGRVGRGSVASACVLLYQPPLSRLAQARLEALRNSQDGFEIARIDLELRGPGEVLGTRQAGEMRFRIADLNRDAALIPALNQIADDLLAHYPERADKLVARWLGAAAHYGEV